MARFGQAFINSLTNPSYGQGLFTAAQQFGAAPAVAREKQQRSKAMEIVNQALASNNPEQLLQASEAIKGFDPESAMKLSQAAGQRASETRQLASERTKRQRLEDNAVALAKRMNPKNPGVAQGLIGADEATLREYLMTAGKTKSGSGYSFGETLVVRDSKGNKFRSVTTRNKDTGEIESRYLPIGETKTDNPVGDVTIVSGTTGAGAFDQPKLKGEAKKETDFSELRVQAAGQLPDLLANQATINSAVDALDSIDTTGIPAQIENEIRRLTGTQSPDVATYELAVGEAMYARLKPLFGGVISEGEREAIKALYGDLKRGNPANRAILKQLQKQVNDSITKSNLIRNSDSFDEYNTKLDKFFPNDTSTETPEQKVTGRFNPETGEIEYYGSGN